MIFDHPFKPGDFNPDQCMVCGRPKEMHKPEEPAKVIALVPKKKVVEAEGMEENLRILDDLKRELKEGKIVSIAGVCIAPDDSTYSFNCVAGRVSKLRTTGALAVALHCFMRRTEKDE